MMEAAISDTARSDACRLPLKKTYPPFEEI